MPWYDFQWTDDTIEHIGEHGLTIEDAEWVIENFEDEDVSRSSGRPMRFAFLPDGRYVAVVFEWIDNVTVYVVTAYEPGV